MEKNYTDSTLLHGHFIHSEIAKKEEERERQRERERESKDIFSLNVLFYQPNEQIFDN